MKKLLLMLACSFACSHNSRAQLQVITLAGHPTAGFANATGTLAAFNWLGGLCVDPTGNIYVADNFFSLIRKITPAGVVTTFAGGGGAGPQNPGSADGTGTAASFYYPIGVCSDASGNIFVADGDNHKIRKITPGAVVTTYAGSGMPGSTDGPAASASFGTPFGVCSDASGNIYVSDFSASKIRKISTGGVVSTFAGSGAAGSANGTSTLAAFSSPQNICMAPSGNLYVADAGNHMIRMITPAGVVSTVAGTTTSGNADGIGTAALFNSPTAVSTDLAGNIYVADSGNNNIRKIDASGNVTTITGFLGSGYQDGNVSIAKFNSPYGIATTTNGIIYVADRNNFSVRAIASCSALSAPAAPASTGATVCAGSTTTLTAISSGTINWFSTGTGGAAIATGSAYATSATLTAGTYTLYAETATDCTVSASRTPVILTVSACCIAPPAPVNTTPSNYYVGIPGSGTLTVSGQGTIKWYNAATGGTAIATGTALVVYPVMQNTYTYYASATTCTVSAVRTPVSFISFYYEGLNEQKNQIAKIYPNPTSEMLTIETASFKNIEVIDITGRVLMTVASSDAKTQVDLGAFASGVYYVKVKLAGKTEMIKVVKQ